MPDPGQLAGPFELPPEIVWTDSEDPLPLALHPFKPIFDTPFPEVLRFQ